MTKEIITLQIGHYANFVGTHLWNLQDASFEPSKKSEVAEVNHDVFYRQGETSHGALTYTPRMVAVDLKGSLKTLRRHGNLCSQQPTEGNLTADQSWDGKLDVHHSEPAPRNVFLESLEDPQAGTLPPQAIYLPTSATRFPPFPGDRPCLDNDVEVWSDFLKPKLHPRTLCLLEEFSHADTLNPFDLFGLGSQLFSDEHVAEQFEDQLRFFSQDCDYLQGFHILLDGYDGFAGVADAILHHLEDEFAKKVRFCLPLYQPAYNTSGSRQRMERVHRLLSTAQCFTSMAERSHLFAPAGLGTSLVGGDGDSLKFPQVEYKGVLPYHTSALLASALDTISLPLHRDTHMAEWYSTLAVQSRKLALPSCSWNDGQSPSLLCSHCPALLPSSFLQRLVYRGPQACRSERMSEGAVSVERMVLDLCPGLHSTVKVFAEPCHVGPPFPAILPVHLQNPRLNASREQTTVLAGLHNTDAAKSLITQLLTQFHQQNLRQYHRCFETGLEMDDIPELAQSLTSLAQEYTS